MQPDKRGGAFEKLRSHYDFLLRVLHAKRTGESEDDNVAQAYRDRVQRVELLLDFGLECKAQRRPRGMRKLQDRACFINALSWSDGDPFRDVVPGGLAYVEGLAWSPASRMLVSHAWCVDRELRVYDPTWRNPEEGTYVGAVLVPEKVGNFMAQHLDGYAESILGSLVVPNIRQELLQILHPDFYPETVRAGRSKQRASRAKSRRTSSSTGRPPSR